MSIHVDEVGWAYPRTLLFGYTCNRNTFHVYVKNNLINILEHDYDKYVVSHQVSDQFAVSALVPNKRVYPERTEKNFAQLLLNRGASFSFTTYTEGVKKAAFYGFTLEDLRAARSSD